MTPFPNSSLLRNMELALSGSPLLGRLNKTSKNIRAAEDRLITSLVKQSAATVFGRQHHFDSIASIDDYRNAVPVRSYEGHRTFIERMCTGEANVLFPGKPLFYTTSGNSPRKKLYPVSPYYYDTAVKEHNALWLYTCAKENPGILNGKCISVIAPAQEGTVTDGTPFGSLSGIIYNAISPRLAALNAIPYPVLCIRDTSARLYAMMRWALEHQISWIIAPNPGILSLFHHTIVDNRESLLRDIADGTLRTDIASELDIGNRFPVLRQLGKNPVRARYLESIFATHDTELLPRHYWPHIACINTWQQGSCMQEIERLRAYFPKQTIFREFGYQSSEIRAGLVLENDWRSALLPAHRFFFEFIEVSKRNKSSPQVLRTHELETGKSYYLIVTNGSGLYRYDVNDIIRITGFYNECPLFEFVQKGESITNLTGEHVSETQILRAVEEAARSTELMPSFYTVVSDRKHSRYTLYAEFPKGTGQNDKSLFVASTESHLRFYNSAYASARDRKKLGAINLVELRPSSGEHFRNKLIDRGDIHEGTYALKCLTDNTEVIRDFEISSCA